jgi:hypothetical protein
VVTTEKDAMRLRRFRPLPMRTLAVPLGISFDPSEHFAVWLCDSVAAARANRSAA